MHRYFLIKTRKRRMIFFLDKRTKILLIFELLTKTNVDGLNAEIGKIILEIENILFG